MADPEHLEILKQGAEVWKRWRLNHLRTFPDLIDADLSGALLKGVDLRGAELGSANLRGTGLEYAALAYAHLSRADLRGANLSNANLEKAYLVDAVLEDACLRGTDLSRADLSHSDFKDADLRGANLTGANLTRAELSYADCRDVDLRGANFSRANLIGVLLSGANLTDTILSHTTLVDNDLSKVKGLESVIHEAPSYLGIQTLYKSVGKISEAFLRGCGLSDWQVEHAKLYQPELGNGEITNILYRVHELRANQTIQISPLFISYNQADGLFVDTMEAHLNKRGVRFWRDKHHSTAGRLERQIDRAIRLNPTVLLILSEHSVESDWVQHEARLARKLEIETKRDVLCPIALDDSWRSCDWPERLREQIMEYNILDFSEWRDEDKFRHMFTRLLDGLDLFYK